ncbi:restriction endonuclease subunit S [Butyrivibrio sp.]|uniref:restriction endonuclease subunit S n=1 Tax=Butyrivibrio sp. TaxID=28121 RepID=UPI0025BD6A94|nr:restriction endonuclease subunit S [Butyrivibrio sp.]
MPFTVPDGWELCRLNEIISFMTDYVANGSFKTLRENVTTYKEPNYALFIRTVDFSNDFKGDLSYIDKESYDFLSKSQLHGGELMLSNIGASIGKIFRIPYFDMPMSLAPNSIIVKFHDEETYDYFECMFKSFVGQDFLLKLTAGTAMPKFSKTELKQMVVPIAPIKEQRRIADECSKLLSLVDSMDGNKEALSEIISCTKSKVLDLAIRGKLVPQNSDDEPASILLDRIRAEKEELIKQGKLKRDKKESVIYKGDDNSYYEKLSDGTVKSIDENLPFEIPNNWHWERIRNLFIINPKNNISDNTMVSFIPMALLDDGYSGKYSSEEKVWNDCKKGFTHFSDGDVCFAKISPCFENRKSAYFNDLSNGYGAGTTELYVLRRYTDDIVAEYLLSFVKSEYFISRGRNTFSGVVGQQRVDKEVMLDTFIPLPPSAEQIRITDMISKAFSEIANIEDGIN